MTPPFVLDLMARTTIDQMHVYSSVNKFEALTSDQLAV
jgi:hypothetical protein